MTTAAPVSDWVTNYGKMVFSLCVKVIQNREAALDASQSVWEIVFRKSSSFRGESAPSTWIYSIACREALRAARKERTRRYRDLLRMYHDPACYPVSEEPLAEKCDACVSGVIGTLNFRARLIFVFRFILDISHEDIASIMGMEQAAVRKTASRARRRLEVFFRDECGLHAGVSHCKCGLEGQLDTGGFRGDILALKTITAKAKRLHARGCPLPPLEYWEKIRKACHK